MPEEQEVKVSNTPVSTDLPRSGVFGFVDAINKPLKPLNIPTTDKGFAESQATEDVSQSVAKDLSTYRHYIDNPNPTDPNLDVKRAENQSTAEQIVHGAGNFLGQLAGGFVNALGTNLDVKQSIDTLTGTQEEYGNALTEAGKHIMEASNQAMPIYEKKPGEFNPSDPAWWINHFSEAGGMVGMAGEALAEAAAITALSEGTGLGAELGNLGRKFKSLESFKDLLSLGNNSQRLKNSATIFGLINRHNMSMMSANDVGKEEYESLKAKGYSDEDAKLGASKASSATYLSNMPLVALDILGFKAMTFNPITRGATGGLADSVIDGLFGHITSPLAKTGALLGFEASKGAFEASWQALASANGKYYADRLIDEKANNKSGEDFNDYIKGSQVANAAASGFIGGAITGGLFKGYEHLTQGQAKNAMDQQYKTFVDGMASTHLELNDKIREAQQAGNDQEANNLRRQLGIQKALTAVHLDNLQNDTAAFAGYKNFFQQTLDAINSNNTEALDKVGLSDSQDFLKQAIPQYLKDADHIKSIYDEVKEYNKQDAVVPITYRKFLMDNLNEQLVDVNGRIAKTEAGLTDLNNLSSYGRELYQEQMNIKAKTDQLNDITKQLKDSNISPQDRESLEFAQKQINLELTHAQSVIQEPEGKRIDAEKATDAEIFKTLDNEYQYHKLNEEKNSVENALNITRKQLNIWQDPEFQSKKKQGQINDVISKTESVGEVDRVKDALEAQNILTDEYKQVLDEKRKSLSAKEESEALKNKPDPTKSPLSQFIEQQAPKEQPQIQQTEDNINAFGKPLVPDSVDTQRTNLNDERKSIATAFGTVVKEDNLVIETPKPKVGDIVYDKVGNEHTISNILSNGSIEATDNLFGSKLIGDKVLLENPKQNPEPVTPITTTIVQEDSLFDPAPINENQLTDEKKDNIRSQTESYTNSLKGDLGREPSFKELVEDFINHTSKDQVDKNYNLLKLGWELNGKKADFNQVYNDIFSDRKAQGLNFFDAHNDVLTTPEELITSNEIISEDEIETQADPEQFEQTETGQPVFKHISPYKTVNSTLKMAHLSLPYLRTMIPDETGVIVIDYKNASEDLNQGQYVDSKELMNPNKWGAGSKGQIRIPTEADDILIAQWTKDWSKADPIKFSEWAKDKDKSSDEYIGRLPMIIHGEDGKGVSFVHDIEWYNPTNIGYADNVEQQAQIIQESRKELLELRKQVLASEGKLDIEVTEKKPGSKYIIPKDKPLISVQEANPQAKVGYVNKLNNLSTKDGIIESDQLINKSDLTIGHKYDIRQAGLDENGKPSYFASKLLYPSIDRESKMSVIQALRVYASQEDRGESLGKQDEIKRIRKQIIEHTGLDLYDKADLEKYLNLFIPTVRDSVGSGKGAEQRVYDAIESNPNIVNGTPFLAINAGTVVFGIKGFKISGDNTVNYFYPGMLGDKASDPKRGASVVNGMLARMFKDDFLGQMKQNMDGKALEKDTQVAHITYDGETKQTNVIPQDKYNDYLKKRLQTNIKSFDLGDGTFTTFIQPVINFTYNKEVKEERVEESVATKPNFLDIVNEATKELTGISPETNQDKIIADIVGDIDKFRSLGLSEDAMKALESLKGNDKSSPDFDPDYKSLTDDIVRSIKTKLTKIEDLDTIDRGHIVQFIANEVMSKIDPQTRNTIEKKQLIADVSKTFEDIIAPKVSLVDSKIGPLQQLIDTGSFPNLQAVVDQLNNFKANSEILKKNWNFLINEAFEDYISKFTGISIKMNRAQDNIDVEIKDQEAPQEINEHEDDQQDLKIDTNDQREKNYSKESIEDNGKNSVSYLVKRFLAQIPNFDKAGNPKQGFMGVTTYPGFDFYYDAVGKMLTSRGDVISDFEDMKMRLSQYSESQPYVNEIIKRLDSSDQQLKNAFMYNFVRDGLSMKFVMTSFDTKSQSYKLKVYDTNANEILRVIQTQWKNNFNQSQLVNSDNEVNTVRAQALLDKFNGWVNNKALPNQTEAKEFLSEFGIELSNEAVKELIDRGYYVSEGKKSSLYPYNKMFTKSASSSGVFGLLARSLELMTQTDNKNYVENDSINPFENMSGILSKLANIESKYSVNLTTNSFRDGDKSIFGFTPGKFATSMVSRLKFDPQVILDKKQISFDRHSFILNLLSNDLDFNGKFGIDHIGINAFKELGKALYQDNELNSLSDADHELVKLGMFQDVQQGEVKSETPEGLPLRIARMFFPTMSDKKTMLDITTAVLDLKPKDLDLTTGELGIKIRDFMFSQLVEPELQRIISHHERSTKNNTNPNFLINQKGYNIAAQIFHFIPEMNNLEYTQENGDKVRLVEFLANSGGQISPKVYDELVNKIKTDASNVINEVVKSEVAKKIASWGKNGYIERNENGEVTKIKFLNKSYLDSRAGTLEEKLQMSANDYVINSLVNNANMHMLVAGDIANFSQDKAFKNGFEKDEQGNPKPYRPLDNSIYSRISSDIIGVNLGKRLAMLIAPGSTIAQSKGDKYIQLFARDRVSYTENLGFLIGLYHGKGAESASKSDIEILKTSKDDKEITDATNRLSKKFPDLAAYLSIESTDAQEYTTAKEHLDILYRQGRLSLQDYEDFSNKITKQREFEKKGLEVPEEAFLSTEDLRLIFQPIKPVVTGQVNDVENDMSRMLYIKSSSFPLISQITQGFPALNEVRKGMEEVQEMTGKNVRLSYDTANKVGSPLNSNQIRLWDNQGNYIPEAINAKQISESLNNGIPGSAMLMDRNNFRIQQDVPFKSAKIDHQDSITLGTQMMKEIFGDGVGQIEDKVFEHNGVLKSGKELMNEVSNHYDSWIRNEKSTLYDQLGVDESTGQPFDIGKTTQKLQNMLQQEAKKRGYPKQDIDALEVNNIYDTQGNIKDSQFTIPLWLSPNSNRYEALLNAVVTSRLLNLDLPGTSSVVGSEEGFRVSKEQDIKSYSSRMIFTNKWEGSLQPATFHEDGKLKKAQVLMPSKFRDKSGKLLDLFKKDESGKYIYVTKSEDGNWNLNHDMVDDNLLSHSTFRIPTSSHVSMSQIEVAGFLPPEAGDLMIVPKNFTKQKGLDFDVDKENAYILHHTIDPEGKLIPIEQSGTDLSNYDEDYRDIQDTIESFQKTLEGNAKLTTLINQYKDEIAIADQMGFDPSDAKKFIKQLKGELDHNTKKSDLKQMVQFAKQFRDLKSQLHQNEIIKSYSSILGASDPRVQRKINKVLSTDFAEDQANLLDSMTNTSKDNKNFTILSDQYQKDKMALGAAGKLGIGVYSNYVVFHSLIQQADKPIYLTKQIVTNKGAETVLYELTIGNLKSDGKLGSLQTLDGSRSISDVNAERQNTATDNEKLQIMGKTNTNELTINVDATLSLMGFDKDKAMINGEEKEISVPYFLLSQPIIKDYVDMMRNVRSNISEYNPNAEFDVLTKLSKKYSNNGEFDPTDVLQVKTERERLTGQKLADNIIDGGQDGVSQQAILHLFSELQGYGEQLGSIQSKTNIQRNGLGKSMFEMLEKYNNVIALASNKSMSNSSALIGDYIIGDEFTTANIDQLKAEGYTIFNMGGMNDALPFAVKPTTTTGALVVHSAKSGYELWSNYFPHNNRQISKTIDDIISMTSGENVTESKKLQMQYEVFDELKKYLYSSDRLGLFKGDPQVERERLFFDRNGKQSLATYLKDLIKSDHENAKIISDNKLVSKFQYTLEKGKVPSIIRYDNSKSEDFNEEYKYQALIELMDKNVPLKDFQGERYTSRMLAKDLINYAYLEGGIQEAIQFVKYIPVEYLKSMGFSDSTQLWQRAANGELFMNPQGETVDIWKSILGNSEKDLQTTEYPRFIQQYFQHNPGRLQKLSEENIDSAKRVYSGDKKLENLTKFVPKDIDEEKPYIAIYNKDIKIKNKYQVYKFDGQAYNRIPTLGIFGMSEYSIKENNVKPLIDSDRSIIPANQTDALKQDKTIQSSYFDLDKGHLGNTLSQISEGHISGLSDMATLLMPYMRSDIKVEIGDVNNGRSRGMYYDNKITIDQTYLERADTTKDMVASTILHEYTHALTSDVLSKYFDKKTGQLIVDENTLPLDIKRINRLYREVEKSLGSELQEFRDWYTSDLNKGTIRGNEDRVLYAGMSVHEFTAMIMSEPDIQARMSEIEYKGSGKSLLEQFVDSIKKVLTQLGIKFDENSAAAHGIDSVLELLDTQNKSKNEEPQDYLSSFGNVINPTGDDHIENLLDKLKPKEDEEPPEHVDLSPEELRNLPDCIF
jgi:hypothetical protein